MAAKRGPLGVRYSPLSVVSSLIVIAIVHELVSPALLQLMSALPKAFLIAVVLIGATTILAAFFADNSAHFQRQLRTASGVLLVTTLCLFVYAVYVYYPRATLRANQGPEGIGGKGGDAKVGGNGVAIGGPGGHAGKYGSGGNGGNGEVKGNGVSVGGEGGAAGADEVWRPPARSGYEIYMEETGQVPDPYGRGGAGGGYTAKLQVIEKLRTEYFRSHSQPPQTIFENIGAVPIDYLNGALHAMNQNWRVRIVQGPNGQYEFFIPKHHQK